MPGHPLPTGLTAQRLVRTPQSVRAVARAMLIAFGVILLGLAVVPWQQTALGSGQVIAYAPQERIQNVEATISGRAVEWFVQEGDRVKAGDPIVELRDNDPTLLDRMRQERTLQVQQRNALEDRIASMKDRIRALEQSRDLELRIAEAEVRMAEDKLQAAQEAVAAEEAAAIQAKQNLDRVRSLHEQGLTPTRELELAELRAEQVRASLSRAQAALRVAQSDLNAARLDVDVVMRKADAAIASVDGDLNSAIAGEAAAQGKVVEIDVRLSRQESQTIVAPRDGVILKVVAGQGGEQVKAGDPLVVIIPDVTQRSAELTIDGNDMPLLSEGQPVRLQFEGWPAVQFSGWPSVAVGTFGGVVAFVDAAGDGQGKFRVLVVPDPNEPPWPDGKNLRQGGKAKGWVMLNTVPLAYELWRQLNDFPPSIPKKAQDTKDEGALSSPGLKDALKEAK